MKVPGWLTWTADVLASFLLALIILFFALISIPLVAWKERQVRWTWRPSR